MKALIKFTVLCFLLAFSTGAYPQFNPAKMATDKINHRAEQKASEAIDKGLDAAEDDIEGNNNDKDKPDEQPAEEQESNDEEQGKTGTAQQEQTPLQSYSKFDFIPGEKVIFYDDFSQDAVGDFPALWNTNGSGEVVNTNLFPGNWLQFSGEHAIWTNDLLNLPDNYTIEFDVVPMKGEDGGMKGWGFRLIQSINANAFDWGAVPGEAGFEYFGRPSYRTYINSDEGANLGLTGYIDEEKYKQAAEKKYHVSIWVQKARIRLYQNESKIIDLPRAFSVSSVKMDRIRFEDGAALVSNVRIAVGAPDTRNKLLTEGKLVTYGIYFDVNKDVVKPESYGTLKDIAKVLTENPDVRVKIIGHTDADGVDASNLDLSKRRAASVKNELVKNFAISESRIETDGMGETQPVAPNDTPSNKALNRRVEFIKL
jgi:outer membrane protein OmpA-like peptidoglycan-associated protein